MAIFIYSTHFFPVIFLSNNPFHTTYFVLRYSAGVVPSICDWLILFFENLLEDHVVLWQWFFTNNHLSSCISFINVLHCNPGPIQEILSVLLLSYILMLLILPLIVDCIDETNCGHTLFVEPSAFMIKYWVWPIEMSILISLKLSIGVFLFF